MSLTSIIFDLDGTLTTVRSPWQYVHERLGTWDDRAEHAAARWLAGKITYEELYRSEIQLWRGQELERLEAFLDEIPFNRHVPEVVRRTVESKVPSIIISSGFAFVARKLRSRHGWEPLLIYANELAEGPEVHLRVCPEPSSPISKRALAEEALTRVGGSADSTLVVSDSRYDLDQLSQCRHHVLIDSENDLLKVLDFIA